MLGAVAGDIIGSPYEWNNTQDRYFELCRGTRGWFRGREVTFHPKFTDDTVMTLAVARWLMNDPDRNASNLIRIMQSMGREYIDRGFAPMFKRWIGRREPARGYQPCTVDCLRLSCSPGRSKRSGGDGSGCLDGPTRQEQG